MGSLGKVWCLDAEEGKTIWESSLGKTHEAFRQQFDAWKADENRYDKTAKYRTHGGGKNKLLGTVFMAAPCLSGDVLVCHDSGGGEKGTAGLVGLDANTGEQRWHVPSNSR